MDTDPERGGIEEMPEPKDKVQALKDQVDGVKSIMTQNVDRILARGERLDDLMGKTEDLQAGSPDWNIVEAVRDHPVRRQKAETSKEEFECLSRSLRTIPEDHLSKAA
ncbi:vesicle-associated membrane protein 8 isoform X2 [Simochromis diagramma]|uniref:vesicle-associated membrane protein 8 isoform X2 n=1 Tax=Simochromis diagramma TaxID=43689 RepID=UPI001A7EA115|nr:vesicle-associated membrane protein 8 isoform X2 [Simochromis diagramma]